MKIMLVKPISFNVVFQTGPHVRVPEEVCDWPDVWDHLVNCEYSLWRSKEPHPRAPAGTRSDQVPHLLPDHVTGVPRRGVKTTPKNNIKKKMIQGILSQYQKRGSKRLSCNFFNRLESNNSIMSSHSQDLQSFVNDATKRCRTLALQDWTHVP